MKTTSYNQSAKPFSLTDHVQQAQIIFYKFAFISASGNAQPHCWVSIQYSKKDSQIKL